MLSENYNIYEKETSLYNGYKLIIKADIAP